MSDKNRELVLGGDRVVGTKDAPAREEPPKHTAGPWMLSGRHHNLEKDPSLLTGFHVHGPKPTWIADIIGEHCRVPREECVANAHLIAAAPELLAALREAVEGCPCSLKERDSGHRTECRAPAWAKLLAKAEGRSE